MMKSFSVIKAVVALAFGLLASVGFAENLQTKQLKEVPGKVIYIGNSFFYYNNSMHGHIREMVLEGMKGHKYNGVSVTISGSGLDWHDVASYFRPDGIGRYSFTAKNEVVFNPPTGKVFDVAVMMDCSQCPIHDQLKVTFAEYAKKHVETVRRNQAEPVFFMSWAYQDKPEMTQQLADAYTKMGNTHKAMVIPAGLAFARSISQRPDINLYAPDKRHPSLAGTYLAGLVTYGALFKVSPVGLKYSAGLPSDVAEHLQKVAQDTLKSYMGR